MYQYSQAYNTCCDVIQNKAMYHAVEALLCIRLKPTNPKFQHF